MVLLIGLLGRFVELRQLDQQRLQQGEVFVFGELGFFEAEVGEVAFELVAAGAGFGGELLFAGAADEDELRGEEAVGGGAGSWRL